MTAEIGLLNKSAVALAADSAVTIGFGQNKKIYQSANKLFMLSKYYPVGIMIYSNASFMDITWESIIKQYRANLGNREFNTLEEYSKDFLGFLEKNNDLFPESQQEKYVRVYIRPLYSLIRDTALKRLGEEKSIDANTLKKLIIEETQKLHEKISSCKICLDFKGKTLSPEIIEEYMLKYKKAINSVIDAVFENLSLTKTTKDKLFDLAIQFLTREYFPSYSGIVIAGYGKKDIFPKLNTYLLEGIANNRIKGKCDKSVSINFNMSAAVLPFAQSEMVHTFMQGVDPDYQSIINRSIDDLLDRYSTMFMNFIKDNTKLKIDLLQKNY
jgi:hypothetical protein